MNVPETRRGRIRNELVIGLVAVILLCVLATYVVVLSWSRRDFDALVGTNDVEIAKSYAASLADYYEAMGSWDGVETAIGRLRYHPAPQPGDDDSRPPERKHPKDSDAPIVLMDVQGNPLYVGIRTREGQPDIILAGRLKMSDGEKVTANGSTVAYVFFKSMIFRSYNPQEEAYIASLTKSIGVSVFLGLVLALALGTALASRFASPITKLDAAVKTIAGGDLSARVDIARIDEIGSLAESFNRMADRLQTTETARQNLLADIAHELRTPVSVIQANLEMILDGVYAADEERLKSLYEETRILTGLISDLRSLSDLEVGIVRVSPEPISLSALMQETCREFQPLFDERGVRLDIPRREEIRVLAEEDRLRQVFGNILGNALKYAPPGSAITVTLEPDRKVAGKPGFARVTIADEGIGVPPGDTERIFERFYRVDASRSRESGGRGLGLAISKRIVEAFHGSIGAYNREPSGLAVWVELPAARETMEPR